MAHKLAAFTMILSGSTLALAQAPATAPQPQTQAELDAEIDSDIANADETSSAHLAVELGVGYRKGLGSELRLAFYQDDEQSYMLRISQYEAKNISHFDSLKTQAVGILLRSTLEGSFFLEGGLDFARIAATINESEKASTSGSGTYGFDGSAQQGYLQMSFGNQWQSDCWTYGVDWINLYMPFVGSSFKTNSSGTIADRELRERVNNRDLKTEAGDINYGMSLHAGLVF